MKHLLTVAALAAVFGFISPSDASAQSRKAKVYSYSKEQGLQGRVYARRVGGYSYSKADSYNTYGTNNTVYGGWNFAYDPPIARQSAGGPFDNGFFFDSGSGPRGGDSPYMH
jgi:hypothetical protein